MQTFIFGLLLAGVSGVTMVAFKYPAGFTRLFPYMFGIATTVFIGISIWQLAIEISWKSLDAYISQDVLADARAVQVQLSVPYKWVMFWYLGVVAFLCVNLKLPPFLQITDSNDTQDEQQGEH